jgi:hypothetical protein
LTLRGIRSASRLGMLVSQMSAGSIRWESPELAQILSLISSSALRFISRQL